MPKGLKGPQLVRIVYFQEYVLFSYYAAIFHGTKLYVYYNYDTLNK